MAWILTQDEPSFIPGLFALYKQDRWAGFFGLSNVVGGGKVEFDNGNSTTQQSVSDHIANAPGRAVFRPIYWYSGFSHQNFEAEQIGLGYTFGGAFEINDMFSVALAAVMWIRNKEVKGTSTISAANPLQVPGVNDPIHRCCGF